MGSVQKELMLSDQLNEQLKVIRQEVDKLSESLEYEKDLRLKISH